MNNMQRQCQTKLELERASILRHLRDPNVANEERDFDPNEPQVAWEMEVRLRSVERALQRLADDRFGVCQACRQSINAERLLALPFVELCIDCQRQQERTASRLYRPSRLSSVAL